MLELLFRLAVILALDYTESCSRNNRDLMREVVEIEVAGAWFEVPSNLKFKGIELLRC